VHFPCGVSFGEIELGEIVVLGFNIGSFRNGKTHIRKDRDQFVVDLAQRVDAPDLGGRLTDGERNIQRLSIEARIEGGILQLVLAFCDGRTHPFFQAINQRTLLSALLGGHRAQGFQQR